MSELRNRSLRGPLVAILTAMLAVWSGSASAASDQEVQQLEARVAELEALVRQLATSQNTQMQELATVNRRTGTVEKMVSETLDDKPWNDYTFGGYVKFDTFVSKYNDGSASEDNLLRQFYVPGSVPLGGDDKDAQTDMQARETRVNFKSKHSLPNGKTVNTLLEMDFFTGSEGDERISNSYQPRLRHALISYDGWSVGQTWSTFQNLGAFVENLDFIGPTEGTVFVRQALVRYTTGPWQFALENPQSTITPYQTQTGSRISSDDNLLPDFVARYNWKGDWGHVAFAGLVRQLNLEETVTINGVAEDVDDDEIGYGLSVSGRFNVFSKDDIRWMVNYGDGIGRYTALNAANGAVLDEGGSLDTIEQIGGYVSYRHFWGDSTWRSNFTVGGLSIDNDDSLSGGGVNKEHYSVHVNLLYDPIPKMTIGAEFMYASRELESGIDGDMTRFIVSAKYAY
ncbi:MAG: DcaP family trimeric outer membrane transporter [Chromatiales bacterium]|jgi:uncharacterized protein YukE